MKKEKYKTLCSISEIYQVLLKANYVYKGRLITYRTVRTLLEKGFFKTMVLVHNWRFVELDELNKIIALSKEKDKNT